MNPIITNHNYASTINTGQLRTDVLVDMLINMYYQIDKIRKEIVLVEDELNCRNNHPNTDDGE